MLFRKTRWILIFVLAGAAALGACSEIPAEDGLQPSENGSMIFEFVMPDGESTRAKTSFAANDRIYVTAAVLLDDGTTVQRSAAMVYASTGWAPDAGHDLLTWPAGAVSASFTAYYLPSITIYDNGVSQVEKPVIASDGSPTAIHFDNLRESTDDPLIAVKKGVRLNGVARLQFGHLMTKLAFTGLKSVSGSTKTKEVTLVNTNPGFTLHNQIIFRYNPQEGYTHTFGADGTNTVTQPIAYNASQAYFFLYVDNGTWAAKENSEGFYVRMNEEGESEYILETWLNDVNLYSMQAGRYYRIYFLDSVVNTELEAENAWYDEKGVELKFETADQIAEYFASLSPNGLTQDLDFNNIPLDGSVISFGTRSAAGTRSLTLANSFNGNYFTIRNINISNGLFASIPAGCTVQNLMLENVKVQADGSTPCSGLLAPVNEGTISNVRISGVNVLGAEGVRYVGGLVGLNKGTIRNVQMTGALTIDAVAGALTAAEGLCVGGVVGANGTEKTGSYTVSGTVLDAACIIRVSGEIEDGDINAGGFVGINAPAKKITGCSTGAEINAAGTGGANCHVGGFAGLNRGALSSCDASGRVRGGRAEAGTVVTSGMKAATGGFVGYSTSGNETAAAYLASLDKCTATGSVHETDNNGVASYLGGFSGFCEIDAVNIASTGTIYPAAADNPERKTGAVAGVISSDKTIANSFSMCAVPGYAALAFCGVDCKTANCHFGGYIVDETGNMTATVATATLMNNASKSGYSEWKSTSGMYGGAPYFNK